jgi:Domain of unknown function (DUF222)/HNH endonuclease
MDSNTHSTRSPDWQTTLQTALDQLAAQDPDRQTDPALADQAMVLGRFMDRFEGEWLRILAAVDARGAAGAEQGVQAASTASWLRARLRMGAAAAHSCVRTARALFRGPLAGTGQALLAGDLSPAHARVLAHTTADLPAHTAAEAEPVLLDAARRLDPPQLRRVVEHLRWVADPDSADAKAQRQQQRRGLWLSPTVDGMVGVDGWLEAEAGQTLIAALEPLARPADPEDERTGSQRRADALTELARRQLEGGGLPRSGGVRPQLLVTVDLDRLLSHQPGLGGELGGVEPVGAEGCRRLACDGAVTRVLVTRHPSRQGHGDQGPANPDHPDPDGSSLAARLQAASRRLPVILGGARTQPLEVGRATRVVSPAQRAALVVRDRGCAVIGCGRPPAWCEAHHLRHWVHGGPTDLANLALVCRAHHWAVHEGGWRLQREPGGGLRAIPPHRRPRPHPPAA